MFVSETGEVRPYSGERERELKHCYGKKERERERERELKYCYGMESNVLGFRVRVRTVL